MKQLVRKAKIIGTGSYVPEKIYTNKYLETLVDRGYKVAIAEQVEEPETGKIHREVTRIVTPGTSMEKGNLDPESQYFLASICKFKNLWGLSHTDISTGYCAWSIFPTEESALQEIHRLSPREILVESNIFEEEAFLDQLPNSLLTPRSSISDKNASNLATPLSSTSLKSVRLIVIPLFR